MKAPTIKDKLGALIHYYACNRGVGHTHTMVTGAARNPCIVLVSNFKIAEWLAKSIFAEAASGVQKKICGNKKISAQPGQFEIEFYDKGKTVVATMDGLAYPLRGSRLPLVVEHGLLEELFRESLSEIERLEAVSGGKKRWEKVGKQKRSKAMSKIAKKRWDKK